MDRLDSIAEELMNIASSLDRAAMPNTFASLTAAINHIHDAMQGITYGDQNVPDDHAHPQH